MEGLIAKQSLNSQKKKTMFGYRYQIYSALYQNPLLRSEMCPGVLENVMEKHLEHFEQHLRTTFPEETALMEVIQN